MPQRWVLACVAEFPEVVANSILIQVHVPILVYARVARWRVQFARRPAFASTVSIGDSPKAPAPQSRRPWRGPGLTRRFIGGSPRRSGHGVYPPQQVTEPLLLNPQVWSCPALTETKEPAGGVALP